MIRTLKELEKLFENKRFLALDGFMKNTQTKAQESFAFIKCEPSWKEPLMVFETAPDYVKDVDLALTELAEIKKIPTQEEVCNALEDDTGSTITFKIRKQSDTTQAMFIIGDVEATFLDFIGYNLKYKTVCYSNFEELSPKTLILIMRFFEGYEDILKGETK